MVFLVIATIVASAVFGVAELGDEIPLSGAVGFALWVGSWASSRAASRSPWRRSSAGEARPASPALVLLGSFFLGGYAPYVPALEPIAVVSWFHWTYGHVPARRPVRLGLAWARRPS